MRQHTQRITNSCSPVSKRLRGARKPAAALILGLALSGLLSGCGDDSQANNTGSTIPVVTADNYKILHDVPGTPVGRLDFNIRVFSNLGMTLTRNLIHGFDLTDTQPPLVIEGHEYLKGGGRYVKSRKLRIENFLEPEGSKMVQVDMSLNSPFALKSLRGTGKNEFVPSPLLQDNIGNSYWPSGYILRNRGGEQNVEISLNRGTQFKNLNDLPRLSRNKDQELVVLFFVNKGVLVESLSYGGGEPKWTFRLAVDDR